MNRRYLLVDLSNNNAAVDLAHIKQAGVIGMWHKVSEGEHFIDPFWQRRAATARKLGLRVGGYHFAHPGQPLTAVWQAREFAKHLGPIHRRDLCPALDLEVSNGAPPELIAEFARSFNHEFRNLTGVWPLLYSFGSFVSAMRLSRILGRGLWLAAFGRNDGREHPYDIPRPYKKALAHQFTSNARIAGVGGACDLSSAPRLVPILARGWRGRF